MYCIAVCCSKCIVQLDVTELLIHCIRSIVTMKARVLLLLLLPVDFIYCHTQIPSFDLEIKHPLAMCNSNLFIHAFLLPSLNASILMQNFMMDQMSL